MAPMETHDLLIVTDATASMGHYLASLNQSLPEIIRISSLTGCFSQIGVIAYRDYNGGAISEWSGWYGAEGGPTRTALLDFTKRLRPEYGGDWPEAAKTGLARAYEVMRAEVKTIMLLYADAPPHTPATGGDNRVAERMALNADGAFGGHGKLFVDWVSASNTIGRGGKTAQVFCVIQSHLTDTLAPFTFLCHQSQGTCLQINQSPAEIISRLSLAMLLAWMGVEKGGARVSVQKLATVQRYKDADTINDVKSEQDNLSETYIVKRDTKTFVDMVKNNLLATEVTIDEVKKFVKPREIPMTDFSQRYKADEKYRAVVVESLADIIQSDVLAMAVNPVFGSLWRTVCNDRMSEARNGLIESFGRQVDKIADVDKRARMKTWLEESYDYAGEITDLVKSVPKEDRFPCVYLDPTLDFTPVLDEDGGVSDDKEAAKPPNKFTREELLEIGRSCDYKILRRLGRLLTRLSYVSSKEEVPEHIRASKVAFIPMILTTQEYERKFWKVLLHLVLPGTMLSVRPAALLAALSLRIGLKPLQDAADAELLSFKGWNTLDIPETWNTNCLSLLLDADKNYRARIADGATKATTKATSFLSDDDRRLFEALVNYKLLEMNLGTTLTAQIGWCPEKTKSPMGPVVACQKCHFPRSVTVMASKGVCGLCDWAATDSAPKTEHDAMLAGNVSEHDDKNTSATWVECAQIQCRAQYVVYHPENLNVRPKCHYCRFTPQKPGQENVSAAPIVECNRCLSRVIWPEEYRPAELDTTKWECSACTAGKKTIVDAETTAKALSGQNGSAWLLRNESNKIAEPLNGRTLFYIISTAGTEGFADKVAVLPVDAPSLTIRGKTVRNASHVVDTLRGWIAARRAQTGTCSLCFDSVRRGSLQAACGRRGCGQVVCAQCFEGWYGLNARGRIINVAALACPFCRRQPTASAISGLRRRLAVNRADALDDNIAGAAAPAARDRRVAAYREGATAGGGLAYLGDLQRAVDEAGTWIYAWCWDCGFARRFVERVCAQGAPAELVRWRCDDCRNRQAQGKGSTGSVIKNCPGCGTPTEKLSGCDHITCTISGCGAHWCFFCGADVGAAQIYEHMYAEHGGLFGGREEEDDAEDADEYGRDEEDAYGPYDDEYNRALERNRELMRGVDEVDYQFEEEFYANEAYMGNVRNQRRAARGAQRAA